MHFVIDPRHTPKMELFEGNLSARTSNAETAATFKEVFDESSSTLRISKHISLSDS
jgi:hypothetical protein